MDGHEAVLAALGGEVVDGFAYGFGDGTHGDYDVLGVGGAVVLEGTVAAAGELADFAHVAGYYVGDGFVDLVAGFDGLEVDVAVLGGAAGDGGVGVEGALAEVLEGLLADHAAQGVFIEGLDLLDFVGSAETVEEVEERHAGLDGGQVGDGRKVLGLLDAAGGEHGKAGLAAGHDVLVVAEDGEGVRGEGAGRYVEYGGKEFARDLVHVRNHEQETLRGGEGAGEGACLEGAVDGAGGTGFTLHFGDFYGFAPEVLLALGGPFVDVLRHCGGRCDRVDGCVLAEQVSDAAGGLVTVTCDEFLFFCHICVWLLDSLDDDVLAAGGDAGHEALEDAAGADFGEFGSAVGEHAQDAPGPADGGGELAQEVLLDEDWVCRGGGRGVLVDGAAGDAEGGGLYGEGELLAGGLHERGVEGAADGEGKGSLGSCGLEGLAGGTDGFLLSGDDELAGGIVVGGDDRAGDAGADGLDQGVVEAYDGGHGAGMGLAALLHGGGSGGDKAQAVLERDGTGGHQGAQFAQ